MKNLQTKKIKIKKRFFSNNNKESYKGMLRRKKRIYEKLGLSVK